MTLAGPRRVRGVQQAGSVYCDLAGSKPPPE
jgi:hypothetical protein